MCTAKIKEKKVKKKKVIYMKNRQYYIGQITKIVSVYFLVSEMFLKYTIVYLFHVGVFS